jgi:hypothetical protein
LPHASDVQFLHLLCQYNYKTHQHEVVAVQYPSSQIEQIALDDFMTMLYGAAVSNKGEEFYEYCKIYGLNIEIILRWMRANGINSAAEARSLGRKLQLEVRNHEHVTKSLSDNP